MICHNGGCAKIHVPLAVRQHLIQRAHKLQNKLKQDPHSIGELPAVGCYFVLGDFMMHDELASHFVLVTRQLRLVSRTRARLWFGVGTWFETVNAIGRCDSTHDKLSSILHAHSADVITP